MVIFWITQVYYAAGPLQLFILKILNKLAVPNENLSFVKQKKKNKTNTKTHIETYSEMRGPYHRILVQLHRVLVLKVPNKDG